MSGPRPLRSTGGRAAIALTVAGALLLASCGSEDLGGKTVKDGLGCTVTEVDRNEEAPTVEKVDEVGEEVETTDVTKAGKDACTPTASQYLTVDLVGATAADGEVFTSTWEDGEPLTVKLGAGQLLPGLETGLAEAKVGSRREIVIPAALAYGEEGNEAQGIGPNEDLVFVVDIVAATDAPEFCNQAVVPEGTREGKPALIEMPKEAPTEVTTKVLEEGDGPEATQSSYLTVDYVGISCATGQQFDSSWDREDPITIAMADAEPTETAFSVIPGWTEGLEGQKQGSVVQIDIPSEKGYGAAGSAPAIGPNDPLVFVVEILEVSDEAPPAPETTTTAAAGG